MADDRFGPWRALTVEEAQVELAGCPAPWWISGGHALELFAGRSWRMHDDLDVGIRRVDTVVVLDHLRRGGWDVVVAAAGLLTPWDGGPLVEAAHQNNVWCRRADGPWQLDVTVGEGDDSRWAYRRHPSITRPWARAVLERDGVRHLAPELQLLFKSKDVRPKDTVDADEVVPALGGGGLALLRAQLGIDHPWRPLVDRFAPACGADDVLRVLDVLSAAGVGAHVDGGWGVDALLGDQTRPHADLDLAIARHSFARAIDALRAEGFDLVRDDGRHVQVFADADGTTVDLHAYDTSVVDHGDDGTARHGGDGLAFEVDGFEGAGTISGRPVPCISPATLVRYHNGYAVDADDWHDVRLLCERFCLPVPVDYDSFRRG
jgi:lincosamide nucleotidyltransferase A/C/D/E